MPIFKKNEKKDLEFSPEPSVKIKKKTKIGIRGREDKNKIDTEFEAEEIQTKSVEDDIDAIIGTDSSEENEVVEEDEDEWSKSKKKVLIKKDLNGKPVFLEDTGEKLGTVFDTIYDEENKLVGYKIKDNKSEAVLSFPANQFEVEKNGLIFVPSWYTNAVKIIEKLEFKDRISPELTALLTDDAVSNNELYEIFVKHDDEMAHYIDDTVLLKERLNTRLKLLEKQRMTLKEELINLTEKRLIKDIDRKEFSEDVMEFRRKANIIDVNIGKCKKLIKRIDKTSFGVIGKYQGLPDIKEEHPIEKTEKIYQEISKPVFEENVKNPYKEKYLDLKEQFNHLEEEYNDLKTAVEKLIHKDELLKTE